MVFATFTSVHDASATSEAVTAEMHSTNTILQYPLHKVTNKQKNPMLLWTPFITPGMNVLWSFLFALLGLMQSYNSVQGLCVPADAIKVNGALHISNQVLQTICVKCYTV